MKIQHTPGPWRIARHDTLKHVRHVDAGPAGYERETVAILDGPQSDANATLIRTAPEMLVALRALLGYVLEYGDLDSGAPAVRLAQKAILDAEGKR